MQCVDELWVFVTQRIGDNTQAMALATRLANVAQLKLKQKKLCFWDHPNLRNPLALQLLDPDQSDPLDGPYPRAIISTGYLCARIALWIKERSPGTKIIQLGRSKKPLDQFDLIITTPQYRLPPAPNHLQILLPLGEGKTSSEESNAAWAQHFSDLPRPLYMLAIGGKAKRLVTDPAAFHTLLSSTIAHVEKEQGSLVIVTSPRTPDYVLPEIENAKELAQIPIELFPFGKELPNPYFALLHLADAIITTNDSASMPADAAQAGRNLFLFEFLPRRPSRPLSWLLKGKISKFLSDRRDRHFMLDEPMDMWDKLTEDWIRRGKILPRRNASAFAKCLYEAGLAKPLGNRAACSKAFKTYRSELDLAVERSLAILKGTSQ